MRARHDDPVIEWLLAGDPAIRWQVMRDLLDESAETWEAERRQAAESGWIAELLERRGPTASGRQGAGRPRPGRSCCSWRAGFPRITRLGGRQLSASSIDSCLPARRSSKRSCHPQTHHSSVHTTFNVLENLRIAADRGAVPKRAFRTAEARALEFMLAAPIGPVRSSRSASHI